jgi:putative Mn2+ efflux pump MntP
VLGSIAKLIALVFPLGLDSFVVAAAPGMAGLPTRKPLRISLPFTTFEGAMWGAAAD